MNIEKPSFKKICLMHLQALTNFPYIEKDFDAITDYELLCKVVDYLNQVISNNNEQNTVVENLYNAFVELKDYVDNYFDNLDVQDEINNKLDEMAEEGTLSNLILNFINIVPKIISEPKYKLIGHRGSMTNAPENTIPSFEIGARLGLYGIECDVQKTSDGVYVIFHDQDIARMTDGSGYINNYTYSELMEFNIDSGANISLYENLKIPTLQEYLNVCYNYNCVPVIELKSETLTSSDAVNIFNIVKSYGLENKCIIISFNDTFLSAIRNVSATVQLQLLTTSLTDDQISFCTNNYVDIDSYYSISADTISSLHSNGIKVNIWTIDGNGDFLNNYNKKADYLTINNIEACVEKTNIKYINNIGLKAFSEHQHQQMLNHKVILRQCYNATGESLDYNLNGNFPEFNMGYRNRCLATTKIDLKYGDYITFKSNANYNMTIKMFDADNNALEDYGWINGNTKTFLYANLAYGVPYFKKANNSDFTYQDELAIVDMINSIRKVDCRVSTNANGTMYLYSNGKAEFFGSYTITPNYQASGNIYSSDVSFTCNFPSSFTNPPKLFVSTKGDTQKTIVSNVMKTAQAFTGLTTFRTSADNTDIIVDIHAIGTWY